MLRLTHPKYKTPVLPIFSLRLRSSSSPFRSHPTSVSYPSFPNSFLAFMHSTSRRPQLTPLSTRSNSVAGLSSLAMTVTSLPASASGLLVITGRRLRKIEPPLPQDTFHPSHLPPRRRSPGLPRIPKEAFANRQKVGKHTDVLVSFTVYRASALMTPTH